MLDYLIDVERSLTARCFHAVECFEVYRLFWLDENDFALCMHNKYDELRKSYIVNLKRIVALFANTKRSVDVDGAFIVDFLFILFLRVSFFLVVLVIVCIVCEKSTHTNHLNLSVLYHHTIWNSNQWAYMY